jgi:hypothetical protein
MFHVELTFNFVYAFLVAACGLGFSYGVYNWIEVLSINTEAKFPENDPVRKNITDEQIKKMNDTSEKISNVIYNF